jgi:hypothetical protein
MISLVESLSVDSLTGPDRGLEDTQKQGFETFIDKEKGKVLLYYVFRNT